MKRVYDLEPRTELFARNCRSLIRSIPKDIGNREDSRQLVRSSGSVAANYIEANEAISKKDFIFRIKLTRKEAKESRLWLNLLHISDPGDGEKRDALSSEALELVRIFNTIVTRSGGK
jgi:four helix bundle protein